MNTAESAALYVISGLRYSDWDLFISYVPWTQIVTKLFALGIIISIMTGVIIKSTANNNGG